MLTVTLCVKRNKLVTVDPYLKKSFAVVVELPAESDWTGTVGTGVLIQQCSQHGTSHQLLHIQNNNKLK